MKVELKSVKKSFGKIQALKGISLDLNPGTRLALLGPNGSGKSTLTRILMGMLACQGEALLDGLPAFEARRELAHRLAYVPQVAPSLGASCGELATAVGEVRCLPGGLIQSFAGQLGLHWDNLRNQPFRSLSGGMKQKLLLAMALASPASLFILDEPTASLDPASRERFFGLFQNLPREASLILSSHRLEEISQMVDRVAILEEGALLYDGPVDQLLQRRALSLIEVKQNGKDVSAWLGSIGFLPGQRGWWRRLTTQEEKVSLLPSLSQHLGRDLTNLLVKDVETMDLQAWKGAGHGI